MRLKTKAIQLKIFYFCSFDTKFKLFKEKVLLLDIRIVGDGFFADGITLLCYIHIYIFAKTKFDHFTLKIIL